MYKPYSNFIHFEDWISHHKNRVENCLNARLEPKSGVATTLFSAMQYSVMGDGKRLRPLLVYAAGLCVQAPLAVLDVLAASVELVHVYSLVHDDLPCMDNDDLRRGRPTCHKIYDESTALLVGDALQSLAFEWLATQLPDCTGEQQLAMILTLAKAIGPNGMAGGQAIDLASVARSLSHAELIDMHHKKTGALILAAIELGLLAGKIILNFEQKQCFNAFGLSFGLLFQVVDDILDCEADTATLGKTAGKDAANNKPTYVQLLGLAGAKAEAQRLKFEVINHLRDTGLDEEKTAILLGLTNWVTQRTY
ncbi:MAG: polyprenyl synthetase family protein [Neisseriaceae bacterium]|nr:polyprenyl synthetase family protein [Neisseriaceae bacterium]